MRIEKALDYIRKHGNPMDKYRVEYLLNKRSDDAIPLKYLEDIQNEDGGFPHNLEKGKHSDVSETCSMLDLIYELELGKHDVCKRAVQFLFENQREDGSWDENPRILEYNPPSWDTPGKLETKTWLTGEVANNLIQLGHRDSEQVKRAVEFLKGIIDENGKVTGYKIATWITTSVIAQLEGIENNTAQKSLNLIQEWLQVEDTDASFLNWYLACLLKAKIAKDHPLVQECLDKLLGLQQENGSWTSVDGERYTVPTTITSLRLLRAFNRWRQ